MPKGLEDVSKYPYLFAALLETNKWSEEDIAKLAGKNLIRVFKEVEAVSSTVLVQSKQSVFSFFYLIYWMSVANGVFQEKTYTRITKVVMDNFISKNKR